MTALESRALEQKVCELNMIRLPDLFEPIHYDISLQPDWQALISRGRVGIDIHLSSEYNPLCEHHSEDQCSSTIACDPSRIFLHAEARLQIQSATYVNNLGFQVTVEEICRDARNDLVMISLSQPLDSNIDGELEISFVAPINNITEPFGMYLSEPSIADYRVRQVLATHLAPDLARQVFPCFDEPHIKTTFSLVLEHEAHLRAISNMQPLRQDLIRRSVHAHKNDVVRTEFATTPPMSTHLLAFAVGELESVGIHLRPNPEVLTLKGPSLMTIWTAPNRTHEAEYALRRMARAYEHLQEYFAVMQPLDKIDILVVPERSCIQAEGWGLLSVGEELLFVDELRATPADLLYSLEMFTRQFVYFWVGDLVTMRSWTDHWLSEGLAILIAFKINLNLYPHHDLELAFQLDHVEQALRHKEQLDATLCGVTNSSSLLSSKKIAAVLRMVGSYLGDDILQLGVREFLKWHRLGSARPADLWSSLEEVSGNAQVSAVMNSWLDQSTIPLIRAHLSSDGRYLVLSQEHFLPTHSPGRQAVTNDTHKQSRLWHIPLTLWISSGSAETEHLKLMMSNSTEHLQLPVWFDIDNPHHWLKLNANFGALYRVLYESRLWSALGNAIADKRVKSIDRLQVASDLVALYQNGYLSQLEVNKSLDWFASEDNDAVMNLLAKYITELAHEKKSIGVTRLPWVMAYYRRTGSFERNDTESLMRTRTRIDIMTALIQLNSTQVISDGIEIFERATVTKAAPFPHKFREQIFVCVTRAGSELQLKRMMKFARRMYPMGTFEKLGLARDAHT